MALLAPVISAVVVLLLCAAGFVFAARSSRARGLPTRRNTIVLYVFVSALLAYEAANWTLRIMSGEKLQSFTIYSSIPVVLILLLGVWLMRRDVQHQRISGRMPTPLRVWSWAVGIPLLAFIVGTATANYLRLHP